MSTHLETSIPHVQNESLYHQNYSLATRAISKVIQIAFGIFLMLKMPRTIMNENYLRDLDVYIGTPNIIAPKSYPKTDNRKQVKVIPFIMFCFALFELRRQYMLQTQSSFELERPKLIDAFYNDNQNQFIIKWKNEKELFCKNLVWEEVINTNIALLPETKDCVKSWSGATYPTLSYDQIHTLHLGGINLDELSSLSDEQRSLVSQNLEGALFLKSAGIPPQEFAKLPLDHLALVLFYPKITSILHKNGCILERLANLSYVQLTSLFRNKDLVERLIEKQIPFDRFLDIKATDWTTLSFDLESFFVIDEMLLAFSQKELDLKKILSLPTSHREVIYQHFDQMIEFKQTGLDLSHLWLFSENELRIVFSHKEEVIKLGKEGLSLEKLSILKGEQLKLALMPQVNIKEKVSFLNKYLNKLWAVKLYSEQYRLVGFGFPVQKNITAQHVKKNN